MKLEYIVKDNSKYKTVRNVLISYFHISHRLLITLKKENSILLNNSPCFLDKEVHQGDKIIVSFDYEEDNSNIVSNKNILLDIIYEDDWYLIVNKSAGIPIHPSILHYEDSLSNGIRAYFDSIDLKKKIRPVNRIDKNTSGLVIFAKNEYIQDQLINQMKNNTFEKEYIAIIQGYLDIKKGTIDEPISRKENSIIERMVDKNGDSSITHYEVIKESQIDNNFKYSVVKCKLETGRTHQIRVHFSYINHPLLGDDLYGGDNTIINRQALHSYKISFVHPITKERVTYISPIPEDLQILINEN